LAVFNPFVGVCIFWLFDIVRPQYMFGWAGLQGDFSQVVALGTLAGWALKRFGTWNLGRGKFIYGLFVAHGVWVLLSALFASNHDVALAFVIEHLKRTLMFTVAITTADSIRRMETLAWVITGSAGLVAYGLNMRYLGGTNEAQQVGWAGMDNNCLAISMVTCLAVAVFLGLYARPLWQKAAALGAAALIGHTVLLTFSRGGMLGLIVAGIAAFAVVPKRPRYLAPVAAAAIVAIVLAGPQVRQRFMTSMDEQRDYSAQSRLELWLDCLEVMRRYPVFGVGPAHFPLIAAEFGWPEGKEAHSLWVQLSAEIGLVGALLLLLFYVISMRRLWPLARATAATDDERWVHHAACMVVTALAGFVISVQFVSLVGLEAPVYVVAIAVATLRYVSQEHRVPVTAAVVTVPAAARSRSVSGRPAYFPQWRPSPEGMNRHVWTRRPGRP
jgi:probable O-glycosylation ligase (exosortase A-associated)